MCPVDLVLIAYCIPVVNIGSMFVNTARLEVFNRCHVRTQTIATVSEVAWAGRDLCVGDSLKPLYTTPPPLPFRRRSYHVPPRLPPSSFPQQMRCSLFRFIFTIAADGCSDIITLYRTHIQYASTCLSER